MSATTSRVRIEGLLVQVRVGVSTRERERPQNVRFDVTLELAGRSLPRRDVLKDVVADYDVLATRVFEEASAKPVRLLETLVGRVAEALLRATPAERVRVAATKVPTPRACRWMPRGSRSRRFAARAPRARARRADRRPRVPRPHRGADDAVGAGRSAHLRASELARFVDSSAP